MTISAFPNFGHFWRKNVILYNQWQNFVTIFRRFSCHCCRKFNRLYATRNRVTKDCHSRLQTRTPLSLWDWRRNEFAYQYTEKRLQEWVWWWWKMKMSAFWEKHVLCIIWLNAFAWSNIWNNCFNFFPIFFITYQWTSWQYVLMACYFENSKCFLFKWLFLFS